MKVTTRTPATVELDRKDIEKAIAAYVHKERPDLVVVGKSDFRTGCVSSDVITGAIVEAVYASDQPKGEGKPLQNCSTD